VEFSMYVTLPYLLSYTIIIPFVLKLYALFGKILKHKYNMMVVAACTFNCVNTARMSMELGYWKIHAKPVTKI
jgi:hypothetical protein